MSESNIFITGISSGLGWGLVRAYLDDRVQVYGVSRRSAPFQDKNFHHLSLDLRDFERVHQDLPSLFEGARSLDLVILNAGILGEIKDLGETNLEDLKEIMDTNLWANKAILDSLFERNLSIKQVVTISSGAAVNGNRGWGGYSISKAALNMLTKLYAAEQPATHFTALAPGLVDTTMQDYLCEEVDTTKFKAVRKLKLARGTPVMPRPEEAGESIKELIPKLLNYPSGEFLDIRSI